VTSVGDVVVSREHLPGRLSAGIGTAAAISAGPAPSLPAAHRARSPARSSAHRTASGARFERQTKMVRLLHLPQRDGDTLHDALKARMADLPAALLRSITWDQGTEMARHLTCVTTSRLVLTTAMAWSGQLPVASRRTPGGLTRVLSAALAGSPWVCRPPGARSRLDSTEA
jgi:hypothetical protein